MSGEQLIAFSVFAFVCAVTPGPNNVILAATGSAIGIMRGLPVLLGITTGFSSLIFVLAFAVGQAFVEFPFLSIALKIFGATLLLWMAWQIAFAPVCTPGTNGSGDAEPASFRIGFWTVITFQWVNPKAWLVSLSAIGTYQTTSETPPLIIAGIFAAVFMVAVFVGCFLWLAAGAVIGRHLSSPVQARRFNLCMGLLLALSVTTIVL